MIPAPMMTTSVVAGVWSRRCLSAQCLTLLPVNSNVFHGCLPALMTPCDGDGKVNHEALVATAGQLMAAGMTGVVYCGSMGDWALLSGDERRRGVEELVAAGIPVVVGTGAPSPGEAAEHAAHAESVGAAGLMMIPRVLSRASSVAAQRAHFAAVLAAAPQLPAVIYNSPYYGFETRADLFFELRARVPEPRGFQGVRRPGRAVQGRRTHHVSGRRPGPGRRRRHRSRPRHRRLRRGRRHHGNWQRAPRRRAAVDRAVPTRSGRRPASARAWRSNWPGRSARWRSSTRVPTSCCSTSISPSGRGTRPTSISSTRPMC